MPELSMLTKMKGDCEKTLGILDTALSIKSTPEMQTLRDNWKSASEAVDTLLADVKADPARDLAGVAHCVLWFMVVHSSGIDQLEQGVDQKFKAAIGPRNRRPRR